MLAPWKESYDQPRQHMKKQRHYFAYKFRLVEAMIFPVIMYGCESWTIKKAECWIIDAFELWCWRRLLTVPCMARRSNQSILKGNQSWIFIGKTDAEAEAPMLWPHDGKNWLIGKDPEAEKDWRQEEKGTTENQMTGWFHQLNGYELEQAPGDGEGQESMACCSPWGCRESDMTERLNWTDWLKEHYVYRKKVDKSNLRWVTWFIEVQHTVKKIKI